MKAVENNHKWKAIVTLTLTAQAPSAKNWSWPQECREVKWVTNAQDQFVTLWVDINTPEDLKTFVAKKIKSLPWVSAVHTDWRQDEWAA
jgi:hypothetical protein